MNRRRSLPRENIGVMIARNRGMNMLADTIEWNITADSVPVLDGWGWDDYWLAPDWIKWHKLRKQKYGKQRANDDLIKYYQDASMGAASYDWRTFNTDFKNYAKLNGFYDGLFEGISTILAKPISTTTTVLDNVETGAERGSKALSWVIPVVVGVGVLAVGYGVYSHFHNKPK